MDAAFEAAAVAVHDEEGGVGKLLRRAQATVVEAAQVPILLDCISLCTMVYRSIYGSNTYFFSRSLSRRAHSTKCLHFSLYQSCHAPPPPSGWWSVFEYDLNCTSRLSRPLFCTANGTSLTWLFSPSKIYLSQATFSRPRCCKAGFGHVVASRSGSLL